MDFHFPDVIQTLYTLILKLNPNFLLSVTSHVKLQEQANHRMCNTVSSVPSNRKASLAPTELHENLFCLPPNLLQRARKRNLYPSYPFPLFGVTAHASSQGRPDHQNKTSDMARKSSTAGVTLQEVFVPLLLGIEQLLQLLQLGLADLLPLRVMRGQALKDRKGLRTPETPQARPSTELTRASNFEYFPSSLRNNCEGGSRPSSAFSAAIRSFSATCRALPSFRAWRSERSSSSTTRLIRPMAGACARDKEAPLARPSAKTKRETPAPLPGPLPGPQGEPPSPGGLRPAADPTAGAERPACPVSLRPAQARAGPQAGSRAD